MDIGFNTNILSGELRKNELMSKHTTWKTGGYANYYFRPSDLEDLSVFMHALPKNIKILWLGFGSNILVRDGGFDGVVISVSGVLNTLIIKGKNKIKLGSGLPCAKAAYFAAQHGLKGIEFLAGIPGTIGGALAMNAGSYGSDIWTYVKKVKTINREGEFKILEKDKFKIGYRSVSLDKCEWFISASLKLTSSTKEKVSKRIKSLLSDRANKQPLGQYSCGSVFKNPPNNYAARLIENCGLKGMQIGGAVISNKHANFIINSMKASSYDIEQLIKHIQATVSDKYGIELLPEVRILGENIKGSDKQQ